jgi:hypothetical protein
MVDHHLEDASFPCHRLVKRYQAGNRRWTGWEGEKDLGWIHDQRGQVRYQPQTRRRTTLTCPTVPSSNTPS